MTQAFPLRSSQPGRHHLRFAATLLFAALILLAGADAFAQRVPLKPQIPEVDPIIQRPVPQLRAFDVEAAALMRAPTARTQFNVDGSGLTIAVLDTGLRTTHVDFAGRVRAVRNFTSDDGGNANVVTDGNGHGTNVAGIAAASGVHTGMAPGAGIISCKVLSNSGSGQSNWIDSALDWVIANRATYNISVVNMSLGYNNNVTNDSSPLLPTTVDKIRTLRAARVAVMIAAGNSFYGFGSAEGMSFPAITRESVSVGAVYDANVGGFRYGDGAQVTTTAAGRYTPFTQRLHESTNAACRTDIFAPGAPSTSAGSSSDTGESTQHGTSQATPAAAGVVLLAQQYHLRLTGQLPTIDQLETWMRSSAVMRIDGDDENDNVTNTGKSFPTLDAVNLLTTIQTTAGGGGGGNPPPPPPPPQINNVTAAFASNTFTLTGTTGADDLTIRQQGNTVTVTAGAQTQVNGKASWSFTSAKKYKLNLNLGDGNDSLSLNALGLDTGTIDLGAGNDTANLSYCTATTMTIAGGAGTDSLVYSTSSFKTRTITGVP